MEDSKKRFKRFCELERCKKEFETNYKQQIFCEPDHQREYHETRRSEQRAIAKRITRIERENKEIKEKLGMK